MSVRVLFFGATADVVGTRELTFDAAGRSAADLCNDIAADHPMLSSHHLLISVNCEYTPNDTQLADGDEVAIFTPVSGG
jgi:molybdopterin synthase sulfur carrier subunit